MGAAGEDDLAGVIVDWGTGILIVLLQHLVAVVGILALDGRASRRDASHGPRCAAALARGSASHSRSPATLNRCRARRHSHLSVWKYRLLPLHQIRATPLKRHIIMRRKDNAPYSGAQPESFRRHVRTRQWGTLPALRQSTLEFIDDLSSTLGVSTKGNSVAGPYASQVPPQAIVEIHSRLTKYFPRSDGSYKRLLLDVEQQGGAGIYLGPRSSQSICSHIARHSIYCPRIWVPNPFCQMYVSGEGGGPLPNAQESPNNWNYLLLGTPYFFAGSVLGLKRGL